MSNIQLYNGDCSEVMHNLIEQGVKVDAIITSPPYDNLRNYNNGCQWSFDKFKQIALQLFELLNDGGVLIWVVGDQTINGSESGTSFKQALYFKDIGFNLHDTMIYKKINYMPLNHNRYEQEWEYMFCLSKGKPKTFNPIRIPCKYAGTEKWGDSSYYKTTDDNLTNVGHQKVNDTKIKGNIFEYRVGSTTSTKKYRHPAMFPEKLVEDQLVSWTNEGDMVLDPFMGAGTTGVVCKKLKRDFIGIEIEEKYFNISTDRIDNENGDE